MFGSQLFYLIRKNVVAKISKIEKLRTIQFIQFIVVSFKQPLRTF